MIDVNDAKVTTNAVPPPKSVATPPEVAKYLHTTPAALAQDRYHGRGLPYVKHGRKVLYRWADVYAYLDQNTVTPGGAA